MPFAAECCYIHSLLPIQSHQDGPAYFPVVAILSLGSPVVMDFTPHQKISVETGFSINNVEDEEPSVTETDERKGPFSVVLMPRSLLIFKDQAYAGKFSS